MGIRALVWRSKDKFYYMGFRNGTQVLRPPDFQGLAHLHVKPSLQSSCFVFNIEIF